MGKSKQDGWFCKKLYSHFDTPLPFEVAKKYVTDPSSIAKHNFLPFLSFEIKHRRIHKGVKSRPIKYASHVDGYIFSYYAKELSAHYEDVIRAAGLHDAVLAYRPGIGDNITFAKQSFEHVKRLVPCVAVGFDIAGFFDNIDHSELKRQWCLMLGEKALPPDHYAVYRAITKYSYVDRDECFDRLGYSTERREQPGRICSIRDFRNIVRAKQAGLPRILKINEKNHGIPQGSALSAVLANIVLYPFDLQMQKLAGQVSGVYRRYCDDILFVAPFDELQKIIDAVHVEITKMGANLQIQDEKTIITHFVRAADGRITLRDKDKPFQYLGFTFDGARILLRPQTLARYWRRAVGSIKRAKKKANTALQQGRNGALFRRKIYRRFTHLGRRNFLTYAKRAARHFDESDNYKNAASWKQTKNHWHKIERLMYGKQQSQMNQGVRSSTG